ncbi:MOSC domain-containing protein [Photobacterium swingsii]|uniref:MOSC domain-containing protein n=1 Tax=Photobacterium swingsii TaxID=680026 RepID=UPI004067E7B5
MLPTSIIKQLRLGKIKTLHSFKSAIDKQLVEHSYLHRQGLTGDEQAESFHGGEDRAILQYESEHYQQLASTFPDSTPYFVDGGFGENFVVAGMNESNMCIGDIVQVGSVKLQLSQPRQPCFKLNHRFQEPTLSRYTQDNAKTGWFYRVITQGEIQTGIPISVIERPFPQWTVERVQHYLYHETSNKDATTELANLEPLADEVKNVFKRRLENNDVENWESRLNGKTTQLEMRIVKIKDESPGIKRFFLSRTDLGPLPDFSAGAHITLALPNGLSRAYSLCQTLADDTYQIAVSLADKSRGGSAYLHQQAKVGDTLMVNSPANAFKMKRNAHHIFVAAGIGITPFIPMIKEAEANNESYELHYCVRDFSSYPFQHDLSAYSQQITLYSRSERLDIDALLNNHNRDTHVYSCGSPNFIELVQQATQHWHSDYVHFEAFSVVQKVDKAFTVHVKDTGQDIKVAEDKTLLDALRENGLEIESSCETGVCGRCKVSYEGEVNHHDTILTKQERASCMTPCVSRAKGERLEISLP